jgi:hypothetical protein
MDVDTKFFEAFPTDGLVRRLAWVDMPADEVPAIWIPATQWMAMHHEHETVAHKRSDCDRNLVDHDGRLSIKSRFRRDVPALLTVVRPLMPQIAPPHAKLRS